MFRCGFPPLKALGLLRLLIAFNFLNSRNTHDGNKVTNAALESVLSIIICMNIFTIFVT